MDTKKSEKRKGIFREAAKRALKDGLGGGGGGSFFRLGKYKTTIKAFEHNPTAFKGENVTVYFRIDSALKTDPGVEPNPVGSTAKQIFKIGDRDLAGTMAVKNCGRLSAALMGLAEDHFNESPESVEELSDLLGELTDPESTPARGKALNVECYRTKKQNGDDIDVCSYSHDPAAFDDEEVARRRQSLDTEG